MARLLCLAFLLSALVSINAFAATPLEPVVIGPTAGNVSDTASAFADGKFLTVWRQNFMPGVGIWGAFSDANGNLLGPAFPVQPNANALLLRVFPEGDSFVLFWSEAFEHTEMCRVDSSGHATPPSRVGSQIPDAFVNGRFAAVNGTNATSEVDLLDTNGQVIRTGIEPANIGRFFMRVFPGHDSFLVASNLPQAKISRYSVDGELLETFTLDTQATPLGVQEVSSGAILVLLRSGSLLATMTIDPNGTQSPVHVLTNSFAFITQAALRRHGNDLVVIVNGGDTSFPTDVEARPLDERGLPAGDPVRIIRGLDNAESVTFADGTDALFVATSPRTASRQIQTFLLRDLQPGNPQIVSTTPSIQSLTSIASNRQNYLAAWEDRAGMRSAEVHWSVLDATGAIHSAIFKAGGELVRHSLVSDGLDYLMLVDSDGRLVARRVARDGTPLGDTPLVENQHDWSDGAAVVPTNAGHVIVWSSDGVVHSSIVMANGSASGAQQVVDIGNVGGGYVQYADPALAWNGQELLLVGTRVETFSYGDLNPTLKSRREAFRLRGDGSLISDDPIELTEEADGRFEPALAATSGDEFLVASVNKVLVVNPDGFVRRQVNSHGAALDLIWDGSSYVLASAGGTIERFSRDGASLGALFRKPLVKDLDVAADSGGHLVIAGVETSGVGPFRAFAYTATDFAKIDPAKHRAVRR